MKEEEEERTKNMIFIVLISSITEKENKNVEAVYRFSMNVLIKNDGKILPND